LDYEKPASTSAKEKISIGSFLPFSTASARRGRSVAVDQCPLSEKADVTI
jgi:hypothetical protein